MTPEYLEALADAADPDKLWRVGAFERNTLTVEQIRQLDTGVALRRYASHVRELTALLRTGQSLLLTPLSISGTAHAVVPTPRKHKIRPLR